MSSPFFSLGELTSLLLFAAASKSVKSLYTLSTLSINTSTNQSIKQTNKQNLSSSNQPINDQPTKQPIPLCLLLTSLSSCSVFMVDPGLTPSLSFRPPFLFKIFTSPEVVESCISVICTVVPTCHSVNLR